MDIRSGYIAFLIVYAIFGGFTRSLVNGENETTTNEGITSLASTTLVQLTALLGTEPVNTSNTLVTVIPNTTLDPIATSAFQGITLSTAATLGALPQNGTTLENISSTRTLLAADPNALLDVFGTSVPNTTLSVSETSVPNTTLSVSETSVPNTTLSVSETSVPNTTLSISETSVPITTLNASETSVPSTTLSSLETSVPNTTLSASGTSVPNTTLSASETSVPNTTFATKGPYTFTTAMLSSRVTTLEALQETPPVLQTSCQDLTTPCINNGTCTQEGTCKCPSSWTGKQCEYPCNIDECPSEINICIIDRKCNLNGTYYCNNVTGCLCFSGWNGSLCNIGVCDNYPCYNGGKCHNVSGSAVCNCVRGATGSHCEHNMEYSCTNISRSARDQMISCIDNIGYYTLVCKPEWSGENCEIPINMTEFCRSNQCDVQQENYCNAVCERGNCSNTFTATKNGYNDTEGYSDTKGYSSTVGFHYRGGCTFGIGDPWNLCNISNCTKIFADGFCDSACNIEECLYDGYDCIDGKNFLQDCSPFFNTPCSHNLTFNGVCDPECNTTDCLYDGFDCTSDDLTPLPDNLVIQVTNINHMERFKRKISLLLRSHLTNEVDVPPGYLKLSCSKLVNIKCFTSIQSAAKFLAAYVAKLKVPDLLVKDIFVCKDGYYGEPWCESQCSDGCKIICHKVTGKCDCKDEFHGIMCNAKCSDNCQEGDGRLCQNDNGDCIHGCKRDYYGPKCEHTCSSKCKMSCDRNGKCIGGCQGNLTHGFDCQVKCPKFCQNSTCDEHGNCHACEIGYHGKNCIKECPKKCSGGCHQTTGECFIGALIDQPKEDDPRKTDYTGVIVGVVASVFIIAGAILVAFLCLRRRQSGVYTLDEEDGIKVNLETVATVKDQNSHMAAFASSEDAVDLDDMQDNSVYDGSQSSDPGLKENSLDVQPFVEINLTADLDEPNENLVNTVDMTPAHPYYAVSARETDESSSDDTNDENSGLLVAAGAPLAASEASLLTQNTLEEHPQPEESAQSEMEPFQSDTQFTVDDDNLPQVTTMNFNDGNISDEEEEEKETRKSSSSSSSSLSENN